MLLCYFDIIKAISFDADIERSLTIFIQHEQLVRDLSGCCLDYLMGIFVHDHCVDCCVAICVCTFTHWVK